MDPDLNTALLTAGYSPTTSRKYASPSHPAYPKFRRLLDEGMPIERRQKDTGRAQKIAQLVAAKYALTTAHAYASQPPECLPRRAQEAIGYTPAAAKTRKNRRAERVQTLLGVDYSGSTAYSLAGRPLEMLPKRAREAIEKAEGLGSFAVPLTKGGLWVRKYVHRKLGTGLRLGDFTLNYPLISYDGAPVIGGDHWHDWQELLKTRGPDFVL